MEFVAFLFDYSIKFVEAYDFLVSLISSAIDLIKSLESASYSSISESS